MRHAAALALCLSFPAVAGAGSFPTRGGESGLLDVPDGEVMGRGEARVGGELRFDRAEGTPDGFGPLPVSLVTGLGSGVEAGVTLREWGQPGDPRPGPLLFGAALKLRLLGGEGSRHAVAVDATVDRFNWNAVSGMRLIASTAEMGRLRVAGFAGAEVHGPRPLSFGATTGIAISILHRSDTEAVVEALTGPRGSMLGMALRRNLTPHAGVSIGASWLPGDDGFRASLGFAVSTPPRTRKDAPPAAPRVVEVPQGSEKTTPAAPPFLHERPRLQLLIRRVDPGEAGARRPLHLPLGPEPIRGGDLAPKVAPAATAQRPIGPSHGSREPARQTALRAGAATGKVSAPKAFYLFPAPGRRLNEKGKKAIQALADFAARRQCRLLVWARTKQPELLPEAERLSEDVVVVAASGPLRRERIAKRVTIRPTAERIEVIVSAVCEEPGPAGSAGERR